MSDLTLLSAHPGAMQRRIWRVLHSATPCEIRDGMDFYLGAYGLCRAFSSIYNLPTSSIAGIYAALSPMNNWHSNVANVLDILRFRDQATVNTTHSNRMKAVRIANGEDPAIILRGRKVRAFWQAISDPSDTSPIPVDRHLLCLALGVKIGSNIELRSTLGSSDLHAKVESAYRYLGEREGVGNRLASIAWFVQRRISSSQFPLSHAPDLLCHGDVMMSHGRPRKGVRRFICTTCKSTRTIIHDLSIQSRSPTPDIEGYLGLSATGQWEIVGGHHVNGQHANGHFPAFPITSDSRGRRRVYCGKSHAWSNSGGWQWLNRFLVMEALGRKLGRDEHVDHRDRDLRNDRLENYRVLLSNGHGKMHWGSDGKVGEPEYWALVAEWSESEGKFVEYDEPKT